MVPSGTGRVRRPKRKFDEIKQGSPIPLVEAAKSRSSKKTEVEKSKRIKLSARSLLANLFMRRISVTNIEFIEDGSGDGGTFADVAMASFVRTPRNTPKGRRLAVKKLRFVIDSNMNEEKLLRLFVNELQLLDKFDHPNIVKIMGFVEDMNNRITWLVFPWEDNGNLRTFLRSGKWEIPERVSLISDVVRGLEYLHTREPPVCHGDLKSLNILVNSAHRALITDFGSARVVREVQELEPASTPPVTASGNSAAETCNELPEFKVTASYAALTLTGPACSFRWAPPEVLKGRPPDLKSDVWALGWIAWEAITDQYPFEEIALEPLVTMKVLEGHLPSIYEHNQLSQIRTLCSIMLKCWKIDPAKRPSSTRCLNTISWIPKIVPVIKPDDLFTGLPALLLLKIGQMHRLQDKSEASKTFEQGLAIARTSGDQKTLAKLLIALADNYHEQSKSKEAAVFYAEALGVYRSLGDDVGRAKALLGLGIVQRFRSNFKNAEASFAEALAIYESLGNREGPGHVLFELGKLQKDQFKYTEAEASYQKSLAIFKRLGRESDQASGLIKLGDLQTEQSKYDKAESTLAEALAIYKSLGRERGRAQALLGLGRLRHRQSKDMEVEALCKEALAIYKSIGNARGQKEALLNLGDVQAKRSKFIEAEECFTEVLAICKNNGNDPARGYSFCRLGALQHEQDRYVEAEASYAEALAIFKSIENDKGRVDSTLGLVEIRIHQTRYAEAKMLVEDAASISARIGYQWAIGISEALQNRILGAERPSTK